MVWRLHETTCLKYSLLLSSHSTGKYQAHSHTPLDWKETLLYHQSFSKNNCTLHGMSWCCIALQVYVFPVPLPSCTVVRPASSKVNILKQSARATTFARSGHFMAFNTVSLIHHRNKEWVFACRIYCQWDYYCNKIIMDFCYLRNTVLHWSHK